jgi:hypothetical protein
LRLAIANFCSVLPRTAVPSIPTFPIVWDDKHTPPHLAIGWGGGLSNYLPQILILPISASQVTVITGVSHHTQLYDTPTQCVVEFGMNILLGNFVFMFIKVIYNFLLVCVLFWFWCQVKLVS